MLCTEAANPPAVHSVSIWQLLPLTPKDRLGVAAGPADLRQAGPVSVAETQLLPCPDSHALYSVGSERKEGKEGQ